MTKPHDYLGAAKIRDVYYSGFCAQTVEQARGTTADAGGASDRRYFLQRHIKTCPKCLTATKWKDLEARVAERLGLLDAFMLGHDPYLLHPDFSATLKATIKASVQSGFLTEVDLGHTKEVAERHRNNLRPPFRPLQRDSFKEVFKDGATVYHCDTCRYDTPNATCGICDGETRRLFDEAP